MRYAPCDFLCEESQMEGQIHVHWNWIVAIDLFGAGLSAGAFIISATAYFLGRERYETITRIGAYIAPFPVIVGILCLSMILKGRPFSGNSFLPLTQPRSCLLGPGFFLLFPF